MLQRFVPLLTMTFCICLFIVLMQFLWRSIDDLVGKGLSVSVISELFFYAALTMVPMALPLAVLLASLMVFGNLGEKFELTAMKAAGISLFKVMKPLIVLMVFVAAGAFLFQNYVLPVAQTKMWTLLFSVRQKSPEVEIPVRSFYDQIPNMNLYVESKNPETGILHKLIIYDLSKGIDNARVILADSGQLNFTEDRTRLWLHLYDGEMFENMRDNSLGTFSGDRYLPFRRESFTDKQIYFPFDVNFTRMDESGMRSQYIGQNVRELRHSIDSIGHKIDSIGGIYSGELHNQTWVGLNWTPSAEERPSGKAVPTGADLDLDSIFNAPTAVMAKNYITQAIAKARRNKQEYEYRSVVFAEQEKLMRRHDIEMQKKFTLSFACLVFFFIGAPLGAIIKKGGLGTPLVISVLLFIFYYIIDNTGYKMARDGKMAVWAGVWLSSAVLLPLGVFLTYKAVGDTAVLDLDALRIRFMKFLGREPERSLVLKEVRMEDIDPAVARKLLLELKEKAEDARRRIMARPRPFRRFFSGGPLRQLRVPLDAAVEHLSDTDNPQVIAYLNKYPFTPRVRKLDLIIRTTDDLLSYFTETKPQNI